MKSPTEWMQLAQDTAKLSPKDGRKVGCVIVDNSGVMAVGFNHAPSLIAGLPLVDHKKEVCAELWALIEFQGEQGILYSWPVPPCPACTLAIAASDRIKSVIVPFPDPTHSILGKRWKERWDFSREFLMSHGVDIVELAEKAIV